MSDEEGNTGQTLVHLARRTIETFTLEKRKIDPPDEVGVSGKAGVFVKGGFQQNGLGLFAQLFKHVPRHRFSIGCDPVAAARAPAGAGGERPGAGRGARLPGTRRGRPGAVQLRRSGKVGLRADVAPEPRPDREGRVKP